MIPPRSLAAVATAAFLGLSSPAAATATLTCSVDDRVMTFDVMAAVGHEALTLSGVKGQLRPKPAGPAVELGSEALMQTWIEGDDLRLRFHVFAENDGPDLDLMVVTRRRTETDHVGRYRLRIGDGAKARVSRGPITCVVG